jgi:hypothetical protein
MLRLDFIYLDDKSVFIVHLVAECCVISFIKNREFLSTINRKSMGNSFV